MRFESARAEMNPAIPIGTIAASAPPAIIATHSPRRIVSNALPMASAPEEQAETVA